MTVESNAFHGGEAAGRREGSGSPPGPGGEALGGTGAPRETGAGGGTDITTPTRPAVHDDPAQVTGALGLMHAVARLTVAGLSRRAWSAEGEGGRRAAYGR
ncbi:hypothetical protein ACFY8O_11720 [Streptomyces argenteolus]|uniref:Uncharacterized protein n=1 Tax=Streptomyces argenteolus TaxID=67274 RepID=A0ABW6X561_9ACTN